MPVTKLLTLLCMPALLCACASSSLKGVDDPRGEDGIVIATGYFTSARPYDSDCESPGIFDSQAYCVSSGKAPIQFVVQEVLVGSLPAREIGFSRGMRILPEHFPLGSGKPVLTLSWERRLLEFGELARTRAGEWAYPVAWAEDVPDLPCDDVELKAVALDFKDAPPTRSASDYAPGEMSARRSSPWVTAQGDTIQLNYGVTLSALRKAAQACARKP
jgi:hypothetical protein